ncbi:hypothetical protein MKW92_024791 [Papaver armeniacum]|nr:hypothetical protein MKW92_024791 [Papaver armeniacum]
MPSCSNVEEDPLDMDGVARYFQDSSPTLNLDDAGLDELLNGNLQHDDGDQFDWDTENPVMNDDNDYNFNNSLNVYFTTNGVEDKNPEYVGDEVETNFIVPFSVWIPVPAPFICHAIHEMRTNVINGPPIVNHKMFDIVKNRTQEGYVLLQDPLSFYYDAICYGLNLTDEENRNLTNMNDTRTPRPLITVLMVRRKRTKALTLNDLTRWFHVPVISKTKRLSILETSLREGNSNRNANSEIETLRKQLEDIYACRHF